MGSRELVFATYLAPCLQPVYEFVARRVGEKLRRPTRLIVGESFDQVRNVEVDFAFLCGLPYVRLKRERPTAVEAIAAPIVQGERYDKRPVYFSDVIVPANSRAAAFGDLRHRTWAYNEPDSHSGYLITLSTLVEMAETPAFFTCWESRCATIWSSQTESASYARWDRRPSNLWWRPPPSRQACDRTSPRSSPGWGRPRLIDGASPWEWSSASSRSMIRRMETSGRSSKRWRRLDSPWTHEYVGRGGCGRARVR